MNKLNRGISAPIAIGVIIVLAVLVGGGILAYQYFSDFPKETILTPLIVEKEIENSKIEVSEDETAGWETYTDDKYGFEFKYPTDYSLKVIDGKRSSDFVLRGPNKEQLRISSEVNDKDYASLTFEKFAQTVAKSNCASEFSWCTDLNRITKFTNSNGLNGYEIYYNESYDSGATNVNGPVYILDSSPLGNPYIRAISIMSLTYDATSNKFNTLGDKKVLAGIASTFKIKVGAEQTVKWKTYKNDQYGFEIRYPQNWKISERVENYDSSNDVVFESDLDRRSGEESDVGIPSLILNFYSKEPDYWFTKYANSPGYEIKNKTINGLQFIELYYFHTYFQHNYYIKTQNTNFPFLILQNNFRDLDGTFEQMLSTFKFTK